MPTHPTDSNFSAAPIVSAETRPNTECCTKAQETNPADSVLVLACGGQDSWTYYAPDSMNPSGICDKTTTILGSDGQTEISTAVTSEANNDPCCTSGISLND